MLCQLQSRGLLKIVPAGQATRVFTRGVTSSSPAEPGMVTACRFNMLPSPEGHCVKGAGTSGLVTTYAQWLCMLMRGLLVQGHLSVIHI